MDCRCQARTDREAAKHLERESIPIYHIAARRKSNRIPIGGYIRAERHGPHYTREDHIGGIGIDEVAGRRGNESRPVGIVEIGIIPNARPSVGGGSRYECGSHSIPRLLGGNARREGENTKECGYRRDEDKRVISNG